MNNLEVALEELKAERASVSARLDAIDLAIDNLSRVISGSLAIREIRSPATRRAVLLDALKKGPLALRKLRELTPDMSGKERSNALQSLKLVGAVVRKKGLWVKA